MRKSLFHKNREGVCHRKGNYICWREVMRELDEPTIMQKINGRRISRWKILMRDRVFDHNMIYGLTEGNFRNFWWELYYKRKDYKRFGKNYGKNSRTK